MTSLPASELGDFAFRVLESEGPNAWLVLVTTTAAAEASHALSAAISTLGEEATGVHEVQSAIDLESIAGQHRDGIVIIAGASSFSDEDWRRADVNRTRLERSGATVLILDPTAIEHLVNTAPNLASWVAGNIRHLAEARPLDHATVEQRLIALRRWSGLQDTEVIQLAEAGSLPLDPQYAEWLTLLGRGDLLAR